jgi:hypothetical protein
VLASRLRRHEHGVRDSHICVALDVCGPALIVRLDGRSSGLRERSGRRPRQVAPSLRPQTSAWAGRVRPPPPPPAPPPPPRLRLDSSRASCDGPAGRRRVPASAQDVRPVISLAPSDGGEELSLDAVHGRRRDSLSTMQTVVLDAWSAHVDEMLVAHVSGPRGTRASPARLDGAVGRLSWGGRCPSPPPPRPPPPLWPDTPRSCPNHRGGVTTIRVAREDRSSCEDRAPNEPDACSARMRGSCICVNYEGIAYSCRLIRFFS